MDNLKGAKRTFYIMSYIILVCFFSAMMVVLCNILGNNVPQKQPNYTTKGTYPSLSLQPMPPGSDGKDIVIWYKSGDKNDTKYWINKLDKFLEPYFNESKPATVQNCDYSNKPDENKVCDFKLQYFGSCTKDYGYGFGLESGGPCIFLIPNKMLGWNPEYDNSSTLPNDVPSYLKSIIAVTEHRHRLLWVFCEGENSADMEFIGPISYYPYIGFHEKYFPFTNIKGYLSPLVAVNFHRPTKGVLINIECKILARNVHHDRTTQKGLIRFGLMVE